MCYVHNQWYDISCHPESAVGEWLRYKWPEFHPCERHGLYLLHNCVQNNFKSLPNCYQKYTGINRPELEAYHSPTLQWRAHPLSVQEEAHNYRTMLTNFAVPSNQNLCFYPCKVYERNPTMYATTQNHSSIKLVITVPGSFLYWCNAKVCDARSEPEVHLSSNLLGISDRSVSAAWTKAKSSLPFLQSVISETQRS